MWNKKNSSVPGSAKPVYGAKFPPKVASHSKPLTAIAAKLSPKKLRESKPTNQPKHRKGQAYFEFETETNDAWDDGDDDMINISDPIQLSLTDIQSSAMMVLQSHREKIKSNPDFHKGEGYDDHDDSVNLVTQNVRAQEAHLARHSAQLHRSQTPPYRGVSSGKKPSSTKNKSMSHSKPLAPKFLTLQLMNRKESSLQSSIPVVGDSASLATTLSPLRLADMPVHSKERGKLQKFTNLISSLDSTLEQFRELSWSGIPKEVRHIVWKILCGYIPASPERRQSTLERKRTEYATLVDQYFNERTRKDNADTFRQIHIDIPRMNPLIAIFQQKIIQELFERILFIWSIRHPACGYVQGMNDLVTPFFVVFLSEFLPDIDFELDNYDFDSSAAATPSSSSITITDKNNSNRSRNQTASPSSSLSSSSSPKVPQSNLEDDPKHSSALSRNAARNNKGHNISDSSTRDSPSISSDSSKTTSQSSSATGSSTMTVKKFMTSSETLIQEKSSEALQIIEADCFWCMGMLMDGIQDNYTFAQPGIQKKVTTLEGLVKRINAPLYNHLKTHSIEFLQFAFRWMNNLLMREIPLRCVIRLWDTYQSEEDGFANLHLYVCAALMQHFSSELLEEKDFQGLMLLLQNLPTYHWSDEEIALLLAEAYQLKYLFENSPQHLRNDQGNFQSTLSMSLTGNIGSGSGVILPPHKAAVSSSMAASGDRSSHSSGNASLLLRGHHYNNAECSPKIGKNGSHLRSSGSSQNGLTSPVNC